MKRVAFLEIGPLLEANWTGVAVVAAALAKCAIADAEIDWRFLYKNIVVPTDIISQVLLVRTGQRLKEEILELVWCSQDLSDEMASNAAAVFTAAKPMRSLFLREAMVIYDLSPLLTPQFHTRETVEGFMSTIGYDVSSSQQLLCISRATRDDAIVYLQADAAKCAILPLGVDIDICDICLAHELVRDVDIVPYVVVLGTLEPRKNGRLVLEYLSRNPDFADRFQVVFVGRDGWLDERKFMMQKIREAGIAQDRILFPGFIGESEKTALIANASFCIYPSFFEGYGLPILEASCLGKLVVCSQTSSMPEVAPVDCIFFDPNDARDFEFAMKAAVMACGKGRPTLTLIEIADRLSLCSWDRCYQAVRTWVKEEGL